jgi:hypothetical protein
VIKISFGCTRDFRVNMWGTSLPEVIGATSIGGRRSDFFTARKLAPGNLGLLQQNLPQADIDWVLTELGRSSLMLRDGDLRGGGDQHHPQHYLDEIDRRKANGETAESRADERACRHGGNDALRPAPGLNRA